jgi:hypothetical protein
MVQSSPQTVCVCVYIYIFLYCQYSVPLSCYIFSCTASTVHSVPLGLKYMCAAPQAYWDVPVGWWTSYRGSVGSVWVIQNLYPVRASLSVYQSCMLAHIYALTFLIRHSPYILCAFSLFSLLLAQVLGWQACQVDSN